ncbi:MAG: AAA family ATPase, partial [Endozoicomonas sp.]
MAKINKDNQQITSPNQPELIHDNERLGKHRHRGVQQAGLDKKLPESKQASGVALAKRSSVSLETLSRPDFDLSTGTSTSGTSERQSKSTGEFYFGNDPLSKQQIIDQLAQEQSSIYCIRSLEDLEKHGLIQQVWLENGQLQKAEGRLFDNEPITLVFDLTTMSPGDIASFNDILQVGPKCNDKPLGDQVRRVFLVNDRMLKGTQAANPDLWRRLGQMSQPVIPQKAAQNDNTADSRLDETLLAQHTTESIPENKAVVTIDFATVDDWYPYLFGSISLNEQGQLFFSEGALAGLADDTHLMFKNAPWDNDGFTEALATALRKGGFEANRHWISMPREISFSKDQISKTELNVWKERTVKESEAFTPQSPFVCINSHSIDSLKNRFRVEGTSVVRADMLANLLNGCHQLVITSKLDQQQWLWLLTQLEQLPEEQRPSVYTNVARERLLSPEAERLWQTAEESGDQSGHARPESHLTYEISPTDTMEFLQQVNLTSQNEFIFTLSDTPLMEALANGTPLIFSGLERNPKLAAMLETLLLPSPYLFIHGHKVDLPKANVTFIRPAQSTGSALIDQVFKSQDPQRQPPENPIYSLLNSLPRPSQKTYPAVPPWSSSSFQHQFEQQAETERQLDGSDRIMPCHQRKALHVLLAKAYRGDSAVYSFIKAKIAQHYPDQPVNSRANRSALQQWLIRHPEPELKDIKADFWTLARHCPAEVHQSIRKFEKTDNASIQALATYLVSAAGRSRQSWLARRLKVNLNSARKQSFFDGRVRSTLRDALIANKTSLKHGSVISETVASVERSINDVLVSDQSDQQKSQKIKDILAPIFQNDRLPPHCEDLPTALLSNQRHTQSWQERRLVHLANRVQEYPMVFLQGEAGAGKTFMAQAIAARAGYPDCQVMQMGPHRTTEELFGGTQLISQQTDNKADHHTEFREGPLLQWALSKNPPLLVLDEANLAPDGLLAPLAGLTREPPVIHYQGREYPLTKNHRIILTGNPDHYEGRHLDTTLKSRIPTFFYHPLPDTVLARSIILPGLPREWSDATKQQACDRLLTLFNHFKALVPGDLTTPRDIKDVLTTVHQILRYYPAASHLPTERSKYELDDITEAQVNALIHRAFMDSLGGAVTGDFQQRLTSLNLWYQGQYPEDSSVVTGADQTFEQFLQALQAENRDADFSPEPVRQLVYRYWQSLDKNEGGRTATLVEGPAGWGKDFILDRTIRLWQKRQTQQQQSVTPFIHINANPNQWSTLVDSVKQAMSQGQLIAISELNLIPSSYLEGLFNDVLTGHAAPGFRLFATINPGSFDGREALSPALKSRCTQVKLGALSQQALEGLIQRLPGMPEGLPQWLSGHFHQLANALDAQNSPVQLSLDDLFSTAKHLAKQSHEQSPQQRPDQWQSAFQQHLSLPFRALTTPLPGLQDTTTALAQAHKKQQRRLDLERIANGVPGLPAPITVKFGHAARSEQREVTVLPNITDQEMMTTVQTVLNTTVKSSNSRHDSPARTSREKTEKPDHGTSYSF